MATIEAVMQGLETRLGTIQGLRVSDTVTPTFSPPFAMVGLPQDIDYHASFGPRGLMILEFQIWVFTSKAWDRTGQLNLAAYLDKDGPKSIRAAVESDRQLGGIVDDCHVPRSRAVTVEEFGVLAYYGGVLTVPVKARGTNP